MKTGANLIAEERQRQIDKEGWTPQHDDRHTDSEMLKAAICYAMGGLYPEGSPGANHISNVSINSWWPFQWDWKWWKPKSRIRNLIRSGALIAAEIDRLQRIDDSPVTPSGSGVGPENTGIDEPGELR